MKLITLILISIGIWSCSNPTWPSSDETIPKLTLNFDNTLALTNDDLQPVGVYFIDTVDNTIITNGNNLELYKEDYFFMDQFRKIIYKHNIIEDSTKTISINDHRY